MSDKGDALESELGRSKYDTSPAAHLKHLLNIGWPSDSALIKRYVAKNGLEMQLELFSCDPLLGQR